MCKCVKLRMFSEYQNQHTKATLAKFSVSNQNSPWNFKLYLITTSSVHINCKSVIVNIIIYIFSLFYISSIFFCQIFLYKLLYLLMISSQSPHMVLSSINKYMLFFFLSFQIFFWFCFMQMWVHLVVKTKEFYSKITC